MTVKGIAVSLLLITVFFHAVKISSEFVERLNLIMILNKTV